jgi:uncharacterized protein YcbK (DUF882 family)
MTGITRRKLIGFGATALSMAVTTPSWAAAMAAMPKKRDLKLHNIHSGETFAEAYWANGHYIPGAMAEIRRVLRDTRTNTQHEIDPTLIDLLVAVRNQLGSHERFEVISGYRSPETNDMLCESSSGVARNSMHLYGKAIDIRLPGRSLRNVRNVALHLKRGGVGYYPESDFVHVDTGPVRHW